MEAGEIIAYNLKRLRNEKNLTLGQLCQHGRRQQGSALADRKRERQTPPSIRYGRLLERCSCRIPRSWKCRKKAAVQIRKKEISALSEDKYHIFNYYAKTNERNFELYQIEVEPGCEHVSIGHSTNSFEYLMMLKGELILEIGGEAYALKKDDAICFDASGAHSYKMSARRTPRRCC